MVLYVVQIFISLPRGTVMLKGVSVLLLTKSFQFYFLTGKCKSFFQKSSLLDKKVEKQKLSFTTILKGQNSSLKGFGYFTAFAKHNVFV